MTKRNYQRRKIKKWDAVVFYNEQDGLYMICYDGKGGAVTSSNDLNVAESKFCAMMEHCDQIKRLMNMGINPFIEKYRFN